jgi:hypothetical protein
MCTIMTAHRSGAVAEGTSDYVDFPPMQNPASYNLREMKSVSHAGE